MSILERNGVICQFYREIVWYVNIGEKCGDISILESNVYVNFREKLYNMSILEINVMSEQREKSVELS